MVLPLYLAMTREEMETIPSLPAAWGRMVCPFDPDDPLPEDLSPGAMLILTDRFPCRRIDETVRALAGLNCGSILLDFERTPDDRTRRFVKTLSQALPCPVAAPSGFAADSDCAVFLPPCPLHVPLADHLHPWQGREVWLETAVQQQVITITENGTRYGPVTPADRRSGGYFDDTLRCRCLTELQETQARFTLFDTPDTLMRKLDRAAALGVSRAVGLYQELGSAFPGCFFPPAAIE